MTQGRFKAFLVQVQGSDQKFQFKILIRIKLNMYKLFHHLFNGI